MNKNTNENNIPKKKTTYQKPLATRIFLIILCAVMFLGFIVLPISWVLM